MWDNLFRNINIKLDRTFILESDLPGNEISAYCEAYEAEIQRAGGIDLQILGIGSDGQIGFNEPCSSLFSRIRIKTLTARTRLDNAPLFYSPEQVPHHVITMGVGTIFEAR